jgi:hypothetical protein
MKYLLFSDAAYESSSPSGSYVGAYDTVEEAKAAFDVQRARYRVDWGEIAEMTDTGLSFIWDYYEVWENGREVARWREGEPFPASADTGDER